jgi:3-oxoacyl-[acyl-carrier-protein] synthase III
MIFPITRGSLLVKSRIISIGSYLPERVLSNSDLEKMVDTSDAWIIERTGIRERRIADEDQAASDLAYEASKIALEKVGLGPGDIDMIIVATISGDMPFPSTACFLQNRLGASRAVGFDINATCSGFLYALYIADGFIRSGMHTRILVVGAEVLSLKERTRTEEYSRCLSTPTGACGSLSTSPVVVRDIRHHRIP